MNARAPRTQHPYRVHYWLANMGGNWAESVVSLCGGIEAEASYLDRTEEEVDCHRCAWKLRLVEADEIDDDHEHALSLEATYEFRRPRVPVTCRDEKKYRDERLDGGPGVTTPDD